MCPTASSYNWGTSSAMRSTSISHAYAGALTPGSTRTGNPHSHSFLTFYRPCWRHSCRFEIKRGRTMPKLNTDGLRLSTASRLLSRQFILSLGIVATTTVLFAPDRALAEVAKTLKFGYIL